jgi:hypothetical protein
MDTTASRFTLRKNAERAARAMIRKGTAPAVDYGIKSSDDGFEIVWKIAKTAPTTDEVETEIAEASAEQPAAASLGEAASQPAPAATEPATANAAPQPTSEAEAASQPAPVATEPFPVLSELAPNQWPHGTSVMVRKRKNEGSEPGIPDGLKVDSIGRVYCTGPGGIWVIAPDGRRIGVIRWPEQAVNFAFGGPDLRTLFCCAHTSVYTLRVKVPGNPHPWYKRRGQ